MNTDTMTAPQGSQERVTRRARPAWGFTLIELIVAVLLFGIVMSSALGLLMSQRTLYDVQADPLQQSPLASPDVEDDLAEMMKTLLIQADAPDSQIERLAL